MNRYLCAIVGAMWLILFAGGSWWVKRAESKFEIVDQLHYRSLYFNGTDPKAPIEPIEKK
jgi:cytochrome oxidase assembly protein ShyY1